MNFFRQIAAPLLLAVFSTVSIVGTGLHLLPGCGHSPGLPHFCAGHGCCGHHHHGGAHEGLRSGEDVRHSHEDCAICRFLALPQALAAPLKVAEVGQRLELVAEAGVDRPHGIRLRPYGARAPPLGADA